MEQEYWDIVEKEFYTSEWYWKEWIEPGSYLLAANDPIEDQIKRNWPWN